MRRRVTV